MATKKKELVSIVVPCFNEEESLPLFYKEVIKVLKKLKEDYELVLVNDGSKDNTITKIKELAKIDKHVSYISFSRNFGKESAMYAGLKNAKGDYVAVMDADLQHSPDLLPQMLDVLKSEDYDSVATKRSSRNGEAAGRNFFSKMFFNLLNKTSNIKMEEGAMDYRLMKRKMVNAVLALTEYNRFTKGIFSWVGFKTYWLETETNERVAGKTSWSFWGLVKYAIEGIVNFSNAPLDLASFLGIGMTLIAFVYLLIIIIKYIIVGDPVQGWATLICVILIIGGIQLFCLGIIGQYVGKTYMETKQRPHYIVDETNIKGVE